MIALRFGRFDRFGLHAGPWIAKQRQGARVRAISTMLLSPGSLAAGVAADEAGGCDISQWYFVESISTLVIRGPIRPLHPPETERGPISSEVLLLRVRFAPLCYLCPGILFHRLDAGFHGKASCLSTKGPERQPCAQRGCSYCALQRLSGGFIGFPAIHWHFGTVLAVGVRICLRCGDRLGTGESRVLVCSSVFDRFSRRQPEGQGDAGRASQSPPRRSLRLNLSRLAAGPQHAPLNPGTLTGSRHQKEGGAPTRSALPPRNAPSMLPSILRCSTHPFSFNLCMATARCAWCVPLEVLAIALHQNQAILRSNRLLPRPGPEESEFAPWVRARREQARPWICRGPFFRGTRKPPDSIPFALLGSLVCNFHRPSFVLGPPLPLPPTVSKHHPRKSNTCRVIAGRFLRYCVRRGTSFQFVPLQFAFPSRSPTLPHPPSLVSTCLLHCARRPQTHTRSGSIHTASRSLSLVSRSSGSD